MNTMPAMPDLIPVLQSFQRELKHRRIKLELCVSDPTLFLHMDMAGGKPRMAFVRLIDKVVTAMVLVSQEEPIEGLHCFGIGWAVPEKFRNRGRAAELAKAVIEELRYSLAANGVATSFYVEAIIDQANMASQATALKVLGKKIKDTVDVRSQTLTVQHYRLIDPDTKI